MILVGMTIRILTKGIIQWWRDTVREGTYQGLRTTFVTKGLRWGIILFIIYEVLFLEKNFLYGLWCRHQRLMLEDQKGYITGFEEFKYLGVKTDKENRQENDIKNRINKARAITAMLNSVLRNR